MRFITMMLTLSLALYAACDPGFEDKAIVVECYLNNGMMHPDFPITTSEEPRLVNNGTAYLIWDDEIEDGIIVSDMVCVWGGVSILGNNEAPDTLEVIP